MQNTYTLKPCLYSFANHPRQSGLLLFKPPTYFVIFCFFHTNAFLFQYLGSTPFTLGRLVTKKAVGIHILIIDSKIYQIWTYWNDCMSRNPAWSIFFYCSYLWYRTLLFCGVCSFVRFFVISCSGCASFHYIYYSTSFTTAITPGDVQWWTLHSSNSTFT